MADIQNLIKVLTEEISTVNNVSDIAYLTRIIERLNTGYFVTVTNFSELPDPTNLKLGLLYYVVNDKAMYYVGVRNFGTKYWETLSPTLTLETYSFGAADNGQLGNLSAGGDRSSPATLCGTFNDWCQVSAGSLHSLAIRTNGTLWAWGEGGSGRLGDGTVSDKSSPVSVVGGFTDWCQVSAGSSHTVAVRANGTLWAWGSGGSGRLGNGTETNSSSPVSVVGGFTDWCQASAGVAHTVAVRQNGTLWSWGFNTNSQLGDGTTTSKASPVSVVGGFTDWCQVSAGFIHNAAVRQNGTLWVWGSSGPGNNRVGDGSSSCYSSPVSAAGVFTDWCQVSVGCYHSAAVRTNGTIWSWGANTFGKLGIGVITDLSESPVSVVGGFTDWCQVSAGCQHTIATRQNGTMWSWGYNNCGQLGDNTIATKSSPVSVSGTLNGWFEISAGNEHTLAINSRRIQC